ncbi:hypothetical protein GCM10023159_31700 [Brevibacterium yomogidense]
MRRFPQFPADLAPAAPLPSESPAHAASAPAPSAPHAPGQVFAVWAGENAMSDVRRRSLDILRYTNLGLDFHLVTPQNLSEYLVAQHPLHPSYEDLSFHHRADYLRAYFMHHHGGAYADIKPLTGAWGPVLDKLNSSAVLWAGGMSAKALPSFTPMGKRVARTRRGARALHPAAVAFKPGSPWTAEWLSQVERHIDEAAPLLRDNAPVQPWGLNPEYPLAWDALSWGSLESAARKYRRHSFTARSLRVSVAPGGGGFD